MKYPRPYDVVIYFTADSFALARYTHNNTDSSTLSTNTWSNCTT